MSTITELQYWSTRADETLPLALVVSPDGEAVLWHRCNRDGASQNALGLFRQPAGAADLRELLRAADSREFQDAPNPVAVVPGEVVRKITVLRKDKPEQIRFVGEEVPASPAFLQAEKAILDLVEKVRRHPASVLAFKAGALPASAEASASIPFSLTVSNPGRDTLRFPLPSQWEQTGTTLELQGLRNDIGLDKLSNSHSQRTGVGKAQLPPSWKAPVPDGWVGLAPGQALELPFLVRFAWQPGSYDVQVSLETSLWDSQGKSLTRLEWVSPKARLVIPPN